MVAVGVGAAVLAYLPRSGATEAATTASTTTTTSARALAPTPPRGSSSTTTSLAVHSPGSVIVLVANGTTTKGLAGKLGSKLTASGYDVLSPTNSTSPASASAIYYQTGYQGDAEAIATAAGISSSATQQIGPSSSPPVASVGKAVVVVVVGPDIASSLS